MAKPKKTRSGAESPKPAPVARPRRARDRKGHDGLAIETCEPALLGSAASPNDSGTGFIVRVAGSYWNTTVSHDARLRAEEREEWNRVAREVAAHDRVLRVLGLRPHELREAPRTLAAQALDDAVGLHVRPPELPDDVQPQQDPEREPSAPGV